MWTEREAEREAMAGASWMEAVPGDRSAPDIFFGGLNNLAKDPTGWIFGEPSALYSNVPIERAAPAGGRSAAAAAAAAAVPDYAGLQSLAPPPAGAVPPPPYPPPPTGAPPVVGADGMVVPTARMSRKERRAAEKRAARVPPSNPEELELARRGEWSYGQDDK